MDQTSTPLSTAESSEIANASSLSFVAKCRRLIAGLLMAVSGFFFLSFSRLMFFGGWLIGTIGGMAAAALYIGGGNHFFYMAFDTAMNMALVGFFIFFVGVFLCKISDLLLKRENCSPVFSLKNAIRLSVLVIFLSVVFYVFLYNRGLMNLLYGFKLSNARIACTYTLVLIALIVSVFWAIGHLFLIIFRIFSRNKYIKREEKGRSPWTQYNRFIRLSIYGIFLVCVFCSSILFIFIVDCVRGGIKSQDLFPMLWGWFAGCGLLCFLIFYVWGRTLYRIFCFEKQVVPDPLICENDRDEKKMPYLRIPALVLGYIFLFLAGFLIGVEARAVVMVMEYEEHVCALPNIRENLPQLVWLLLPIFACIEGYCFIENYRRGTDKTRAVLGWRIARLWGYILACCAILLWMLGLELIFRLISSDLRGIQSYAKSVHSYALPAHWDAVKIGALGFAMLCAFLIFATLDSWRKRKKA